MNNFLYTEFLQACAIEGTNPTAWALSNGLSSGTPTHLKRGVRPTQQTLEKLVHSWTHTELGINLALAHLKDEIERMKLSLDTIEPVLKNKPTTPELDEDLKLVADFMKHAPIRESIHELAKLLRASEWAQEDNTAKMLAEAEESAKLQRARKPRKTKTA